MRRTELTDTQFALLTLYLQPSGMVGHPWADHRLVINGLFWKLRMGAPWRDIPERYDSWQTVYDRFVWWRRNGTWECMLKPGSNGLSAAVGQKIHDSVGLAIS